MLLSRVEVISSHLTNLEVFLETIKEKLTYFEGSALFNDRLCSFSRDKEPFRCIAQVLVLDGQIFGENGTFR